MTTPEDEKTETAEKPTLDELVEKKKEELRSQKAEKISKKEEKGRIQKEEKRSTITIIQKEEPGVIIENLPRTEAEDIQELVFETVGVKDAAVERHGYRWSVILKNEGKRRLLVEKLNGSFCKESSKNLRVYIK